MALLLLLLPVSMVEASADSAAATAAACCSSSRGRTAVVAYGTRRGCYCGVRGNKTNFVQKSPEISLILNKIVLVEKILKGSLDSIPSPSPSVKIQIKSGKVCLRCKSKTNVCWHHPAMVKSSSIFVAFLENMNFKNTKKTPPEFILSRRQLSKSRSNKNENFVKFDGDKSPYVPTPLFINIFFYFQSIPRPKQRYEAPNISPTICNRNP